MKKLSRLFVFAVLLFCLALPLQGKAAETDEAAYWESRLGTTIADINSDSYNKKNILKAFKGHCKWYAWGRMREVTGHEFKFSGELSHDNTAAKYWLTNVTNYRLGQLGPKCVALQIDRFFYGHVVFVEAVIGDTVYFTESNLDGNGRYDPGVDCILKKMSVRAFKGLTKNTRRHHQYFLYPANEKTTA